MIGAMRKPVLTLCLLLAAHQAQAQNTVTLTPSVTAGDGTLTTDISWSTSPPIPAGTPCVAGSTPAHPMWTGPKPDDGAVTGLVFTASTRLTLSCTFPGDSIATFTWTPATTNTDGTAYAQAQRGLTRLRHTLNATLSPTAPCNAGGVTCVDLNDAGATRPTMHTVTGITAVATLRGVATHVNANGVESAPSNVATKSFTGSVVVNQGVDLTIRSIPNGPTGLGLN